MNRFFSVFMFVALCFASPVSAATRVFYDGFESGNTNLWSQDDFHNRCTVQTTATDGTLGPHLGTRMARCNSDGVAVWNTPERYESLATPTDYSTELFVRAWMRLDLNHEKTGGSAKKVLRFFHWSGENATYNDMFGSLYGGNGLVNECVVAGAACATYWGGSDSATNPSAWHKIEYYFNVTTGVVRIWHDGIRVRNDTYTPGFNGAPWNPLYLTSNWEDDHDALNHLYFDDVEMFSDATSGTAATGSMSDASIQAAGADTTPPAAPTGLAVE